MYPMSLSTFGMFASLFGTSNFLMPDTCNGYTGYKSHLLAYFDHAQIKGLRIGLHFPSKLTERKLWNEYAKRRLLSVLLGRSTCFYILLHMGKYTRKFVLRHRY